MFEIHQYLDRHRIATELARVASSEDKQRIALKEAARCRRELGLLGFIFPEEPERIIINSIDPNDPNQSPF
jgi:hypothetical protein